MVIPMLIIGGFLGGSLVATFLLISIWFAWTPLPLIFRMPLAIALIAPFGLIASAIPNEPQLAVMVAFATVACVITAAAADRSASFTVCLLALIFFCLLPVLGVVYLNPALTDAIQLSMFGFTVILVLILALLSLPLRLFGFRLEQLTIDAGDQRMRLASGQSVDQWIMELSKTEPHDIPFAEIVIFASQRGLSLETGKHVAKAVCRSLGQPAPRVTMGGSGDGLSSWLRWATSGPRREQYSIGQLMLWVASSSILFAILARTGIDLGAVKRMFVGIPTILLLGAAINLTASGWLWGRPRGYRFLMISSGCLCFGMASYLFQLSPSFAGFPLPLVPMLAIGTMLALNYLLMHLRREGFRLIRCRSTSKSFTICSCQKHLRSH